jgi:hypothetical protein
MLENSSVAAQLADSQEGLNFMELVSCTKELQYFIENSLLCFDNQIHNVFVTAHAWRDIECVGMVWI